MPFGESDAPNFFGRQRDCEIVVANLTTSRLTLLYAGSGVGKSSLLRAGVLPRLQEIARDSYEDLDVPDAAIVYIREWCSDPLVTIATEILGAISRVPGASPVEIPGSPQLSVPWLREVIQRSGIAAIYLILDQFEEYFRYHPDDSGEDRLGSVLGSILSTRDLQVNVLVSIREDELAALDRFKGRIPRLYENYLRLAHLTRDAARKAIEGPLDHYNQMVPPRSAVTIEPELTEALLDQVRSRHLGLAPQGGASSGASSGREDIETPFLQLVLVRLWEHERARGSSVLRHRTLDELGEAQKIVQAHLATVMEELSPEQRAVAAKVFRYLVTPTGAKNAQPAETLAEWSGERVETVRELLRSLSAGRRNILRPVPSPRGGAGSALYEIFHDVMGPAVLEWRRNYEEQQQRAEASRRLEAERQEASRRLAAEREEARVAAEAARRQLRLAWLAAGLAAILLIVSGGFAWWKIRIAEQQEYLTRAATTLSYNPVESLKYAVDAYQVPSPWFRDSHKEARSAVLIAASSPRSSVIVRPNPMMIGMKKSPDDQFVVAYDAHGGVRVIDAHGDAKREARASGLRGTVIPGPQLVAVSPAGSRVALATDQGMVAVIDTVAQRSISIESGAGLPRTVTWIGSAADGLVLVVSSAGVAKTYNPDTGKEVTRFPLDDVTDAAPVADQRHVVTSHEDTKLRVWDARTGTRIAESPALDPAAFRLMRYAQSVVSFSVVGLSAGTRPSIVVWDWQAGRDPIRFPIAAFNDLPKIAVDEHAKTVMIAHDKVVHTYSLETGSPLASLPPQADFIMDVTASPDGRWIATAGADGRVLVWLTGNQRSPAAPAYELHGHQGAVTQVSYLPEGRGLLSLGDDGTVRRWVLPEVSRFEQHVSGVAYMDLSRDGSWLATASQDGRALIINPREKSNPPVATVGVGTPLRFVLFDPTDPHRVLTLGQHDTVPKAWSWSGAGEPQRLPDYQTPPLLLETYGRLISLAISPDGKTVAGGDDRGVIHLWDTTKRNLHTDREFRGAGPAESLAFDPRGQWLAATGDDGIHFWTVGTAKPPLPFHHPHATGVAFAPSGKHIVSTAGDGTVKIWNRDGSPAGGDLLAHGHPSSPPRLFEPTGGNDELLAVGTAGGLVEIWDVGSGETVLLRRHHSASVNSVVFLPGDGTRLLSASDDATVAQFDCRACADPNQVIRDAERWVESSKG